MAFLYTLLSRNPLKILHCIWCGLPVIGFWPVFRAGAVVVPTLCVFLITKENYNLFTCTQTGGKMNLCLSWDQYIYEDETENGMPERWETIFGSVCLVFWHRTSWSFLTCTWTKQLTQGVWRGSFFRVYFKPCWLFPTSCFIIKSNHLIFSLDILIHGSFTESSAWFWEVLGRNQRTWRKATHHTASTSWAHDWTGDPELVSCEAAMLPAAHFSFSIHNSYLYVNCIR